MFRPDEKKFHTKGSNAVIQYHCVHCDRLMPKAWHSEYVDGKKIFYCARHWATEKKKRNPEKEMKHKSITDNLDKWYKYIYDLYGGVCAETGRKLSFDKKYCAHLLPKKNSGERFNYSHFSTDPLNGILVDWHIHSIIDKGSPAQRLKLNVWGELSNRRKKMLEGVGMEYDVNFWLNATF